MKVLYYRRLILIMASGVIIVMILLFTGCTASKKIQDKSGAQLWSENCQRCHNTPPPTTFSDEQWETVGLHMQTRALLTDTERNKIVEFLQSSNN